MTRIHPEFQRIMQEIGWVKNNRTIQCEGGCDRFQQGDKIYSPVHYEKHRSYFCEGCYDVSADDHPGWLEFVGEFDEKEGLI